MFATLGTKAASSLHDCPTSSSASHTPHRAPPLANSPNVSVSSIPNMENLDLDLSVSHMPHSRPIGESSKVRPSGQMVTHISAAVLAEMEAGWSQGEESLKGKELILSVRSLTVRPGENKFLLEGKVGVVIKGCGKGVMGVW